MKMNSNAPKTLYIGLDVHKAETVIAILESERDAEPRHYGSVSTSQHALERVMRRIAKNQKCQLADFHVCYEASGCGFWIARRLLQMGIRCEVIAPSEIGTFSRFEHPKKLMAFLGLVPTENSSGTSQRRGAITKCGNPHARWILIEQATHYRVPPKVSAQLSERQKGTARWIKELSWKTQTRLSHRFSTLRKRQMHHNKIKVSVARELTAFLWDKRLHAVVGKHLVAGR